MVLAKPSLVPVDPLTLHGLYVRGGSGQAGDDNGDGAGEGSGNNEKNRDDNDEYDDDLSDGKHHHQQQQQQQGDEEDGTSRSKQVVDSTDGSALPAAAAGSITTAAATTTTTTNETPSSVGNLLTPASASASASASAPVAAADASRVYRRQQQQQQQQQQQLYSPRRRHTRYMQQQQQQYTFLATRVVGGSALVDKQTGRVFWEEDSSTQGSFSGSGTTTLWENLVQKHQGGAFFDNVEHFSSIILTTILSLVVLKLIMQAIRQTNFMMSLLERQQKINQETSLGTVSAVATATSWSGGLGSSAMKDLESIRRIISYGIMKVFVVLFLLVEWILRHIPFISSVVVVTPRKGGQVRPSVGRIFIIIGLYLVEAFTCQTRRYLSNTFSSSSSNNGAEEELYSYIEQLKMAQPVVTWTITKFHYETRRFIKLPIELVQNVLESVKKMIQQILLFSSSPSSRPTVQYSSDIATTGDNEGINPGDAVSNFEKIAGSDSASTTTTNIEDTTSHGDTRQYSPPVLYPLLTKRVISQKVTATYDFGACHDYSTIGVWEFPRDKSTGQSTNYQNNNNNNSNSNKAEIDGNDEQLSTSATQRNNAGRHNPPTATTSTWTKFVLTKLVVLSNERARKDYFQQQSEFVDRVTKTQSQDGLPKGSITTSNTKSNDSEYIQFSTRIDIPGYRPRLLLVENHQRPQSEAMSEQSWAHETNRRMIDDILLQQQNQRHEPNNQSIAPYRAGLVQFWFWTLLGMTLPYRIWFKRHCEVVRVSLIKETMMQSRSSILSRRNNIQDQQGDWGWSYYQSWKDWFTGERSAGDD